MASVFKSPQFQWALYQGFMSLLAAAAVAFAPWLLGAVTIKFALAGLLGASVPILNRLREGVGDATRANEGKVLERDVTQIPQEPEAQRI